MFDFAYDTHYHFNQPEMQVQVILASKAPDSPPIYTVRMRYPRIIHAEIMTHRVFSRNARSSRAVPVKTMLEEIRNKPFVPWHWGKNQKGMQAGEEHDHSVSVPDVADIGHGLEFVNNCLTREEAWLWARDRAVEAAQAFDAAGYHKQVVNRLIEPFSWIDTLITSTHWTNFLWLRDHEAAEPHLRDLARLVQASITKVQQENSFRILGKNEWHLPYIDRSDMEEAARRFVAYDQQNEFLCMISAARCARISYKPFDGDATYERELERYQSLVASDRVHASPMEHQATPDAWFPAFERYLNPGLHGNLSGYIQFRKTIPNEARMENIEEMAA